MKTGKIKSELSIRRELKALRKILATKKLMAQAHTTCDAGANALAWVLGETTVSPLLKAEFVEQAEKAFLGKKTK